MKKKEIEKALLFIIPVILFVLILLVILTFHNDSENVVIDDPSQTEPPITEVFNNQSSMEESQIRELVESKRKALQNFFKDIKYYSISEIDKNYTKEDDEKYIVIGETYLNQLRELLTVDAFGKYWDEMSEIASNDLVNERIYLTRSDLFTDLYTNSAIATQGVNEETLILLRASDFLIEAKENIKYCEENYYNVCQRDDKFALVLELEDDKWKISEFTKLID